MQLFSAPAVYQRRDAVSQRPLLNGRRLNCIVLLSINDLLLFWALSRSQRVILHPTAEGTDDSTGVRVHKAKMKIEYLRRAVGVSLPVKTDDGLKLINIRQSESLTGFEIMSVVLKGLH